MKRDLEAWERLVHENYRGKSRGEIQELKRNLQELIKFRIKELSKTKGSSKIGLLERINDYRMMLRALRSM